MLLVLVERYPFDSPVERNVWVHVCTYLASADDPRQAVEQALKASQEEWGGVDDWLVQFDLYEQVRVRVYEAAPDSQVGPLVYEDTFCPHERYGVG